MAGVGVAVGGKAYYYPVIVLALDTTTRRGSCALADLNGRIVERGGDPEVSPGARLPGDLMALLDGARVALEQVDVFAVATGPGSFTGLRVGIATMQGLAFACGRPLVGVSGLDALAACAMEQGPRPSERVATWVDAWRGEVYAALYAGGRELEAPIVATPEAILGRFGDEPVLFIGDGAAAHADRIAAALGDSARVAEEPAPLLASAIARLAAARAQEGECPPPDAIRPLYVRRPDAELSRDARSQR